MGKILASNYQMGMDLPLSAWCRIGSNSNHEPPVLYSHPLVEFNFTTLANQNKKQQQNLRQFKGTILTWS